MKTKEIAPTEAFMATLNKQKARGLVVEGLAFWKQGRSAYSARFNVKQPGRRLALDVTIGPMSTLEAIEDRVLNALRPGGTL